MTITRDQVAELEVGDVVELRMTDYDAVVRGPLYRRDGALRVGDNIVRYPNGQPCGYLCGNYSLVVVSYARPPIYVNSDKKKPNLGDIVRSALEGSAWTWVYQADRHWHETSTGKLVSDGLDGFPLRLLVDGLNGQVVA